MTKEMLTNIAVLVGALVFNVLFWKEKMGLNTFLFATFLVATLWFLNKDRFLERTVQLAAGGVLLSAIFVFWHNSLNAKFIHILTIPVLVGAVQIKTLRFLGSAFFLYGFNLIETPRHALKSLDTLRILRGPQSAVKSLRYALLPVLILPIFYAIYYNANPKFALLADSFWENVFKWLSFDWDLTRFAFFLFGFGLVGAALWTHRLVNIGKIESEPSDSLNADDFKNDFRNNEQNSAPKSDDSQGEELKSDDQNLTFGFSIEDRYRNSLTLLISLNALILMNNLLDFQYVWLGGALTRSPWELKQYVHEGTFLLIWGIILAIVVLYFQFRGALNFHKNSKILRGLGYAWLAQNAFLTLSVGCRNWQYIAHCGLAYKRIGVFIFLLLTLIGLFTMYLKINEKRTFFFVMCRMSWAFYAVLLANSSINWDIFITRYNIQTPVKTGVIDVHFLLDDISAKNLPLLLENKDLLKKNLFQSIDGYGLLTEDGFEKALQRKQNRFLTEQSSYSWLSFNLADKAVMDYLKK